MLWRHIDINDWLQGATERQIDSKKAAKTLSWQLVYENANKDCRAIIGPLQATTRKISEFIKACQDVGTEQHKASFLATGIKGDSKCYNCGNPQSPVQGLSVHIERGKR